MTEAKRRRPRPSPELLALLHQGKSALRTQRAQMPLPDKIRMVIELQRICLPLIERRRGLAPWERPWSATP